MQVLLLGHTYGINYAVFNIKGRAKAYFDNVNFLQLRQFF